MGIATSLGAVATKADIIGIERPTITMPMWALSTVASELEADLKWPGLFPMAHRGFRFWGITFAPSDLEAAA